MSLGILSIDKFIIFRSSERDVWQTLDQPFKRSLKIELVYRVFDEAFVKTKQKETT